jgi:hypothetical protein
LTTLVMSASLASEYEAVCRQAEHRLAACPVETHFLWRPQFRDPGDEMVLERMNGRVVAPVTL